MIDGKQSLSVDSIGSVAKGTVISNYSVIKLIGKGGMGEVYLVENREIKKKYALKVLLPDKSKKNDAATLKQEARLMARLRHKNIVSIIDYSFSAEHNFYYILMEYYDPYLGRYHDLEQLLKKENRLNENQVKKITLQLCSALIYAHGANGGVVHRDLKPSNVIIDKNGDIHISDFGLARAVNSHEQQLEKTSGINLSIGDLKTVKYPQNESEDINKKDHGNEFAGTYEYMAPEQQEGEYATRQSDIFSLGLIIYRMLAGKKAKGRFELPSKYGCSKKWNRIVEGCLKDDPERRISLLAIENLLTKKSCLGIVLLSILILIILMLVPIIIISIGQIEPKNPVKKPLVKVVQKTPSLEQNENNTPGHNREVNNPIADKDDSNIPDENSESKDKKSINNSNKPLKDEDKSEGKVSSYGKLEPLLNTVSDTPNSNKNSSQYQKDLTSRNKVPNLDISADQLYQSGVIAYKNSDFSKAYALLQKASAEGSRDAGYLLGMMYQRGDGLDKPNQYRAIEWFKKAAENGQSDAMIMMAKWYYSRKEFNEAYRWMKRAAERGNRKAQVVLPQYAENKIKIN